MVAVNILSRITICNRYLQREVINNFSAHKPYVGLCFRKFSQLSKPPWKVIFYGNDQFSLESLKILNDNRIGMDSGKIVDTLEVVSSKIESPVWHYATAFRIPIHNWPYIVPENKYDVGVVVSFGHMIPSKSIQACNFGMLNAHASLLPRWRGAAPLIHTILNGDKTTGITILQVSPHKFDRGKILYQKSFDVPSHSTSSSLSLFLAPKAARMVLHCLRDLPNLMKYAQPQPEDGVTYACKLSPSMGLINWSSQTSDHIDRQYRAMNDVVKLYTEWHGVQIKLTNIVECLNPKLPTQLSNCSSSDVFPGFCFYNKEHDCICIKCKDGWVGFREIGLAGRKKMTAQDFHNGYLSKLMITQCYFGKRKDA